MMPGYATKPWHLTSRSVQPFQITLTKANPSTKITLRIEALRPWDGSKVNLSRTCITHAAWTPLIYHWAKILLAIQSNLSYSALPFSIWPPLPVLCWVIIAIWTNLITSPLWFFWPTNTCLRSRDVHLTPLQSTSCETPYSTPHPPPQTATKDDYLGNIRLIVHLGQLLIKTPHCFCVFNKATSAIVIEWEPPSLLCRVTPLCPLLTGIYESLPGNTANGVLILTCLSGEFWWNSLRRWRSDFEKDWKGPRVRALCHMVPSVHCSLISVLFRWRCLSLCMSALLLLCLSLLPSIRAEPHSDCLGHCVIGGHFSPVGPAVDRR